MKRNWSEIEINLKMKTTETFRTKRLDLWSRSISGIILAIMGFLDFINSGNYGLLIIGVLFGITSIIGFLNLFPSVSSLTISANGFLVKSFFRKTFVNWDEIESFENKKVFFQNKIAIHFQPTYGKKFLGVPIGKRRNNFTAVLPYQYNVKAEELQKRLEEMSNN